MITFRMPVVYDEWQSEEDEVGDHSGSDDEGGQQKVGERFGRNFCRCLDVCRGWV